MSRSTAERPRVTTWARGPRLPVVSGDAAPISGFDARSHAGGRRLTDSPAPEGVCRPSIGGTVVLGVTP